MRFYKDEPKPGDVRTKSFFAFLPVKCGNETRWLEWVRVEQTAIRDYNVGGIEHWSDIRFIDGNAAKKRSRKQKRNLLLS